MLLKRLWKWLVLFMALGVIVWRAPLLWTQPRLWAEEGLEYLGYAYSHTAWQALIAIHHGYYALWPNVATWLALKMVPLAQAPLITTLLALVAQLLPLAVVLWGRSTLWPKGWQRLSLAAIILLTPSSGEVWLNTINSQFFWALTAFLILMEDMEGASPWRVWLYRLLLVVAGLTGTVAAFMIPVFIARAILQRKTEPIIQAVLLTLCAIPQGLAVVALQGAAETGLAARLGHLDLPTLAAILWNRTIIYPLLGGDGLGVSDAVIRWLAPLEKVHAMQYTWVGLCGTTALLAFLIWWSWREWRQRGLIAAAYLIVAVFTVISATVAPDWTSKFPLVSPGSSERYFYAPAVMLMALLLSNVQFGKPLYRSARSLASALLVAVLLVNGARLFKPTIAGCVNAAWPRWSAEVQRWQSNPDQELGLWPEGWKMTLPHGHGGQPR